MALENEQAVGNSQVPAPRVPTMLRCAATGALSCTARLVARAGAHSSLWFP